MIRPTLALLLAACQPLGELGPEPPACAGARRELAPDAPLAAGFTAEDVLAFAAGRFEEEVIDASGRTGGIRVDLAYADGRVLACEGAPLEATATGGATPPTLDRLDVEVVIAIGTDDGRLDDEAATTWLSSVAPDGAIARYTLDPAELNGAFATDAEALEVEARWTPAGSDGVITGLPDGAALLAWPAAAYAGGL